MCGDHGISVESVCEEIMGFQWRACEIMGFQWRAYVRRSWDFSGERM
jgi:hypothetical protein